MYINLTASACFIVVILILIIDFNTKERIDNIDNRCFKFLSFSSMIGLLLEFFTYYLVLNGQNIDSAIIHVLGRVIFLYYVVFMYFFIMYVFAACFALKNESKIFKNFVIVETVIYFVFAIIISFLPFNYSNSDNFLYPFGQATNFSYLIGGIGILFVTILSILRFKTLKTKKSLPIFVGIFLAIISVIVQIKYHDLLLLIPSHAIAVLIMYFTIENPDVKMLQQMTLAKDMAEKANRAKSDFLSSMSHEIRTPLNAIVGLSEDIASYKDQVPNEVALDITDIQNASQTLLEIVGNILDINKIESEKMEIINNPYNLKEEIISLCNVTTTRIKDKPIEFKLDIAPDIPEELIGDRIHIKQVINNLLSNAIKYTEQGNITLSVKCINEKDICKLIISVQDTGRGIKAENINKLFTKFERLDVEMNSTTEGTGLGLAITKSLVEMMGGKINVQSQFGKGSIFIVYLPQKISKHQSEKIDININELPIENQKDLSGKKILIVDDNKLNIKVAIKALQDFNFEIEECYDGLECLEKVKEKEYDLILMDIMMPNMSGESALAKLKENREFKTPVIALTADAVSGAREKYIKEGFADYISKPFNKEQVKEKIEKIFTKKEEEINKSQMVTYVYDSRTNEEYIVKDGQRDDLNNQS